MSPQPPSINGDCLYVLIVLLFKSLLSSSIGRTWEDHVCYMNHYRDLVGVHIVGEEIFPHIRKALQVLLLQVPGNRPRIPRHRHPSIRAFLWRYIVSVPERCRAGTVPKSPLSFLTQQGENQKKSPVRLCGKGYELSLEEGSRTE